MFSKLYGQRSDLGRGVKGRSRHQVFAPLAERSPYTAGICHEQ
ncbi:hypothetical protein [Trichocoleus sp. FACHB-591]|nr:hypothetical protein [Trichocoleus sp. FACHB-591]